MSRNLKISGALVAAVLLVVLTAFVWSASRSEPSNAATGNGNENGIVLREDSNVLGEKGSTGVTLVEFLDFECPACAAFYPYVEDLRADYEGQVTFVARHFPLPGHFNAMNASLAVQAAAEQDQFEAMYAKMYETQTSWGNQQTDHAATFRGFAGELGLDLAQYDADVADPATRERVQADLKDGTDLGVEGTPSFFLNGEKFQPESMEEFRSAIDEALSDAA